MLEMAHTWAAVLLKTPELMLDESEAKKIADAYAVFAQHHTVPVLTEKRMSEINLIGALCMTYGTRIGAVLKRRSDERAAKRNLVTQIDSIGR